LRGRGTAATALLGRERVDKRDNNFHPSFERADLPATVRRSGRQILEPIGGGESAAPRLNRSTTGRYRRCVKRHPLPASAVHKSGERASVPTTRTSRLGERSSNASAAAAIFVIFDPPRIRHAVETDSFATLVRQL
jgi:hypothetical protein